MKNKETTTTPRYLYDDDATALRDGMEEYRDKYGNLETDDNVGFARQRAQELVERRINKMAGVDFEELDTLAELGDIHVCKREADWGDKKIPVYVLRYGYPACFLQSAIDYRQTGENNKWTDGRKTSDELIEDPSLWTKSRKEIEERVDHSSKTGGVGYTIQGSFINLSNHVSREVQIPTSCGYAWNSVPPTSVKIISARDAVSSHMVGDWKTEVDAHGVNILDNIIEPKTAIGGYNEIDWARYDERGNPRPPDFITIKRPSVNAYGKINEMALRHAAYHGVPIVIVDYGTYDDQEKIDSYEKKKTSEEGLSPEEQDEYEILLFLRDNNILSEKDRQTAIGELKKEQRIRKYEESAAKGELTEEEQDDYDMLTFFRGLSEDKQDKTKAIFHQLRPLYGEKAQDVMEKHQDTIIGFLKLAAEDRIRYWKKAENIDIELSEFEKIAIDFNLPLKRALQKLVTQFDEVGLEKMGRQ